MNVELQLRQIENGIIATDSDGVERYYPNITTLMDLVVMEGIKEITENMNHFERSRAPGILRFSLATIRHGEVDEGGWP